MKKAYKKKEYSEGQVTTILEDIRDQFQAFGEGQEVLSNKLDETNERLSRVEDDVIEIKHSLSAKADLREVQKLEKRVIILEQARLIKRR